MTLKVFEEVSRLCSILDNTPPVITPYESESFITDLEEYKNWQKILSSFFDDALQQDACKGSN